MYKINLREIQKNSSCSFEAWSKISYGIQDEIDINIYSVPEEIVSAAQIERKRIHGCVKEALPIDLAKDSKGLYLFADIEKLDALHRIVYIGMVAAKNHSLQKRMVNHLMDELSILDPSLSALSDEEAKFKIKRRLQAVLPNSKRIEKYLRTHMKARKMSRADTVLIFPVQKDAKTINDAETALIVSACPKNNEERSFVNKAKTKKANGKLSINQEGYDLARKAIETWCQQGLGEKTCEEWLKELNNLENSIINSE